MSLYLCNAIYLELVVIDSPVGVERVDRGFSIKAAKTPLPAGTRMGLMLNFRVRNLAATLDRLRAAGVTIKKSEDTDYGKFAWVDDPDGNRLE